MKNQFKHLRFVQDYTKTEDEFVSGEYLIEVIEADTLKCEIIMNIKSSELDELELKLIKDHPLASRFIFSNLDCKCI